MDKIVSTPVYIKLQQTAIRTAEMLGIPSFYIDYRGETERSSETLKTNALLRKCFTYLDEASMDSGHGISHAEAVALDAGSIIQIEGRIQNREARLISELIVFAQIAGLLHDIKRKEKDHTIAGSNEAKKILKDFQMEERYKRYIVAAIRNHEAFKEFPEPEDEIARLISDSLYDADKFRWGPDNFTTTLWLMFNSLKIPMEMLHKNFTDNMRYIESIKTTFRTQTGKNYGPEFIDKGIIIGQVIYKEMTEILSNQSG